MLDLNDLSNLRTQRNFWAQAWFRFRRTNILSFSFQVGSFLVRETICSGCLMTKLPAASQRWNTKSPLSVGLFVIFGILRANESSHQVRGLSNPIKTGKFLSVSSALSDRNGLYEHLASGPADARKESRDADASRRKKLKSSRRRRLARKKSSLQLVTV